MSISLQITNYSCEAVGHAFNSRVIHFFVASKSFLKCARLARSLSISPLACPHAPPCNSKRRVYPTAQDIFFYKSGIRAAAALKWHPERIGANVLTLQNACAATYRVFRAHLTRLRPERAGRRHTKLSICRSNIMRHDRPTRHGGF